MKSSPSDAGTVDDPLERIRLAENPDGHWTARDLDADVSVQGAARTTALEALERVIGTLGGEGGHEPTDEELLELDGDPEVARSSGDLPDMLPSHSDARAVSCEGSVTVLVDFDTVRDVR